MNRTYNNSNVIKGKYKKGNFILFCIAIISIYVIFWILSVKVVYTEYKYAVLIGKDKYMNLMSDEEYVLKLIQLIPSALFIIINITFGIPSLIGKLQANGKEKKEKLDIKNSNSYNYFRELPNNYGIGIATLLFDSAVENEKDIVAVILDLCAKGYLNLKKDKENKYNITVIKSDDEKLLANEKYVLNSVLNNDIKKFDYDKWFECCMNDGIELGLFKKREINNKEENWEEVTKRTKTVAIYSAIIGICIYYVTKNYIIGILIYMISIFVARFKGIRKESFNIKMLEYLELTKLGKNELQKLYSFKNFIKDFGLFAERAPEEIILWDHYLSYAQVFGLSNEILKYGYDNIIKNASFQIDNIDLIKLNEISIDN